VPPRIALLPAPIFATHARLTDRGRIGVIVGAARLATSSGRSVSVLTTSTLAIFRYNAAFKSPPFCHTFAILPQQAPPILKEETVDRIVLRSVFQGQKVRKKMATSFKKAEKSKTAGNFVFLLLSFPLGLLYFMLMVTGFAVGVGTAPIVVGIPILFVTAVLIRGMATLERNMATSLLHLSFPSSPRREVHRPQSFLQRFGRVLSDPYTWSSAIYMLFKLPLGILSFALTVALLTTTLAVTLLPAGYLVTLLVNGILLANGIHASGELIPGFIVVHEQFDLVMFARSCLGTPIGIVLWFGTRFLLNSLAQLSGEMALALLGPREADEAEALAHPDAAAA
jgi:hypothetical protein